MCKSEGYCVMLNKHYQRKIDEMVIRCLHKKAGCKWSGPVSNYQDHLDKECPNVEIECTNKCGEYVQRQKLANHLEESCCNCQHNCLYCGFEDTYAEVNKHFDVCVYKLPSSVPKHL